jgi:hypothetical protein
VTTGMLARLSAARREALLAVASSLTSAIGIGNPQ